MVGTIIVWVTWWASTRFSTPSGSKRGMKVVVPPMPGVPRMPPIDAAWNIGVWCR